MQPSRLICFAFAALVLGTIDLVARPATISIAAAANLTYVLVPLDAAYRATNPDVRVTVALGASGNLFAQLVNGAPFDVFLSADTEYPQRLAHAGAGEASTLHVFATGRLVVWTTRPGLDPADVSALVRNPTVKKLAIAQPRTAPYGAAAKTMLETLGLWTEAQPKLVVGENISQAAQFVETGNADVGVVAMSLVVGPPLAHRGHWTEVPVALYPGIALDQACILTTHGSANPAARKFLEFLHTPAAIKILRDFGYATPAANPAQ